MPSEDTTLMTIEFLRDYASFGSRGHLLLVQAIEEKMRAVDDANAKKLLTVKIYQEFMSALEDLGALCIAIRHRDEGMGLVYNYLTYGQKQKKEGQFPHQPG